MMRSLLLVPPDCKKDMAAALESGADCLVFDLAQPTAADDRLLARKRVFAMLQQARQGALRPLLYVRVASLQSEHVDDDLDAVMRGHPDGIVLSESQNGADVQHLSVKLAVREAELGLNDGATKIIAIVAATAASIFELGTYRGASRRLVALLYGGAGLGPALGIAASELPDKTPSAPFALARSLMLFAAKAANVVAIDAALPADCDPTTVHSASEAARRDGFSAKLAVAPEQIAIIGAVFAER